MKHQLAHEIQRARRIALGTVQFGMAYGVANQSGQVPCPEALRIVKLAADSGINTIDTAVGYGDSERYLGEIGVAGFKIVTKLPAMPPNVPDVADWVNAQIGASLARLGISQIYGLLLHRPVELLGSHGQALFKALCGLKDRSLVQKIGISIYSPSELPMLVEKFRIDVVQTPLNLVDRRLLSCGWLQRLKDQAVEIHTRSSFLQGLLLMPRHAIPVKFARWDALWDRWHQWLERHNEDAMRACLTFPLSHPEVDRVVVGVDNAAQLKQVLANATLASVELPDLACEDEDVINPSNWSKL